MQRQKIQALAVAKGAMVTKRFPGWIIVALTSGCTGSFGAGPPDVRGTTGEAGETAALTQDADAESPETRQPSRPQSVPLDLIPGARLDPSRLVRLSRTDAVWLDRTSKNVIVAGSVCNRQGPLEMFACPRGTKEYESVVAVDSRSQIVHAALLAAGIRAGKPVVFAPEYKSATGPTIEITVVWIDPRTKKQQRIDARQWVRHVASMTPLSTEWVFAGSGFWKDPDTGEEHYLAEGGELVCVSNFATATLDLPVASPDANDNLFFDAFTDHIPPLGTQVWLLLREKKNGPEPTD